jgi:hypothetical protein
MKTSPLNDLRVPNVRAVAAGSYLITGLPRIRSAWLSALLSTEMLPCYHEAPTENMAPIDTTAPFGLLDPGAACLYPQWALSHFSDRLIILIERPINDSKKALEKFAGMPATNWKAIEDRYLMFREKTPKRTVRVKFRDLARYEVVAELYSMCTHGKLSRQRFELFDGLRVEQDIVKRAKAEAA